MACYHSFCWLLWFEQPVEKGAGCLKPTIWPMLRALPSKGAGHGPPLLGGPGKDQVAVLFLPCFSIHSPKSSSTRRPLSSTLLIQMIKTYFLVTFLRGGHTYEKNLGQIESEDVKTIRR